MKLVRAALGAPYTVIVAVLAIVVLGLTSVARMPVDMLPQFQTPAVQVVTFYPGMPAEVMEKDITTRLERWTGQSAGIAKQESRSMIGVSIVKDFIHENVDPAAAIAQVSSYAMSDMFYLPPGTIPPMVMPFDPTASLPLALITVSSPKFDETKLYDVAYFDLRNRLQGISGVIAPAVYGGKLRRILAYVERDHLQARGLSPLDVVGSLKEFSTLIPTGNAKLGDLDYQIITNGMPKNVAEMNDFPIKIENGAPVFLRDVGRVEDSHQIQTNVVRIAAAPDLESKRQVYIPIYRQPGSNTIQIVDGIRAALDSILARLPEGINLDVVMDQSVYVRQAIGSLVNEGMFGGGLAASMILLFIGSFRSTLMISVAIPLSILAAFIGLYFSGNSVNAMVLGGLALAVGRLVDDAIVVLENTDRHLAMGKPPRQAALDGAGEVAMPVLVATITTIVVFFPVVFLTGIGKFLFTPLAVAVAFSIGASYFVAMMVVPVYCARFLRHEPAATVRGGALGAFERGFDRLRDAYRRRLQGALAHKAFTLGSAAALLAVALALAPFIGTELFPETDAGQLSIRMRAPSGTRIERTEDLVARVEREIRQTIPEDELRMVISNIGVLMDWPAAYTPNAGPQDAFFEVQLGDDRSATAQEYAARLRGHLGEVMPGVDFSFHTGGLVSAALNFGLPSPIDVQVSGNDLHVARDIAEKARRIMAAVPGAADVRIQQRLDYPAIEVEVISRVIDVFANVAGRDVGSVASEIERRLGPLQAELPAGYSITSRGEVQSMRESFSSLGFGFVLASILVYLVMVAQFRSFLDPFIIMFAVPLGIVGVVAILLATGTTLNVQSFMGVIFMVGIAVSNSVLLVEFANRLREDGKDLDEAIVEASAIRLRPIIMTSLAAVLGLLPMAIGLGHGSEANVPLARAVVGGLSVSTLLTLFVVPVLYKSFKGRRAASRWSPRDQ
jgi:multidrug efflux pump subunit AcrB